MAADTLFGMALVALAEVLVVVEAVWPLEKAAAAVPAVKKGRVIWGA